MSEFDNPHISIEVPESREQFEERVIMSVYRHAEGGLYRTSDKMPYHNRDHMSFVHDRVVQYCDYVESYGKKPDRFALRLAAILHDAAYYDNLIMVNAKLTATKLISKPFKTQEDYSAWIAGPLLESYGVGNQTINKVQRLIKKTHFEANPNSLEAKILVRADLDNISGPEQSFVMNTLKLVREAEILNGPKNPFERIAFSYQILNKYAQKDLSFGDFDIDIYKRTFKDPAKANIARIADHNVRRTISRIGSVASTVLPSLGKVA